MAASRSVERSSFSIQLEHLLLQAGIKNATLADALNYDISYISKWITGSALPSRKNIERVLTAVSTLAADQTDPATRESLRTAIGVSDDEALRDFVSDSLRDAYYDTIGESGASQYLHNATLRVKPQGQLPLLGDLSSGLNSGVPLQIAVFADLFSLERSIRLSMAGIQQQHFRMQGEHPDLTVDYIIDLNTLSDNSIYDVILLIHMMTGFSAANFHIYHSEEARGKLLIAVKDEFAGISLLTGNGQTLCTTLTREKKRATEVYDAIYNQIDPDRLIFLTTDMKSLLLNLEYFRNLLSQDLRWLVGHVTEHFLPESLFRPLLDRCFEADPAAKAEAERAYQLTSGILQKSRARIMLYRLALADFMISGELDFFNHKITLPPTERHQVLCHIRDLIRHMTPDRIKLVKEGFSDDFKYITNPCMFLSESASYLRLENGRYKDNLLLIKESLAQKKFDAFFETIWTEQTDAVISDHSSILLKLDSLIDTAGLLFE